MNKVDIKNVQSLMITIGDEKFVLERSGKDFVFNKEDRVETENSTYVKTQQVTISENIIDDYTWEPLTYTKEYKEQLEDEYEASLQNKLEEKDNNTKKRVRKYNQIAKKLEEYQKELEYANCNFDTVNDKAQVRERITVLSNMIVLLQWVLKQR